MNYGGITFKHVWDFQLRIMLGNQYAKCKNATEQKDIIVACLRLGWNDAFRHTSKNIEGIEEKSKENTIIEICDNITDKFIEYAEKTTTQERHDYIINECINDNEFKNKFAKIKVTDIGADKTLCFGHIQKMFSMALKLFLCLKICAEQAKDMDIDIGLNVELFECDFSFETADCPIDSIIIDRLNKEMSKIKWSKLGQDDEHPSKDYIKIQKAIEEKKNDNTKSNLCFDFENWN